MATTTFQSIIRSYGGSDKSNGVTPVPVLQSVIISFDPTASSATAVRIGTSATVGNTLVLPIGAVPVSFVSLGGATGGTSPTVDIGTSATTDGFFNEADADTKGVITGANGSLVVGTGLAAQVTVTGKVGASAATGGTTTGIFNFTVYNDGAISS